jgi:acyl-coenzyme A thioesterase PaaI-like protein
MSSPRPADADFEQRVRDSFARQQFLTLLGVELARVEPGRVVLELVPRAEHGQQHGYVHAGSSPRWPTRRAATRRSP